MVRVRLLQNVKSIELRALGLLVGPEKELDVKADLNWRLGFEPHAFLLQSRDSGDIEELPYKTLEIQAAEISINGQPAPLHLYLKRKKSGFDLVAEMELEDYLKGVLASEMPASWPLEALKAQAVASRTFALVSRMERKKHFFHLESTVMSQVYNLAKYRALNTTYKAKVERAIDETRGQHLVWEDTGRLYKSYYHSHCGGQTEEPRHVWGYHRKRGTTKDTGCGLAQSSVWQVDFEATELKKRLLPELAKRNELEITNIEIDESTGSGRAKRVKIDMGEHQVIFLANEFRSRLGFGKLKSTMFSISKRGTHYRFQGRGFGHGVGMCQTGSRLMAMGGADYKAIVEKYYPKANFSSAETRVALRSGR